MTNGVSRKIFIFIMTSAMVILSGILGFILNSVSETKNKIVNLELTIEKRLTKLETKFEPMEDFIDKVNNGELLIIRKEKK